MKILIDNKLKTELLHSLRHDDDYIETNILSNKTLKRLFENSGRRLLDMEEAKEHWKWLEQEYK